MNERIKTYEELLKTIGVSFFDSCMERVEEEVNKNNIIVDLSKKLSYNSNANKNVRVTKIKL